MGLAAHRVVQEGITNAAKHAPGAAVTVTLARRAPAEGVDGGPDGGHSGGQGGVITVMVVNGPPAEGPLLPPGGGRGLTGLAERVRLAGGTMRAGPTAADGFEIVAELPAEFPLTAPTGPAAALRTAPGPSRPREGAPEEQGEGGTWASESARHLERERRQVRRGLITAIAVPAGLISVLGAVMVGYYVYATFNSVLHPADYAALRVGQGQESVERALPPMEAVGSGDVREREPEPAGADCHYYRPDTNLLGVGRWYRLCFSGGRLASKNTYWMGSNGRDRE